MTSAMDRRPWPTLTTIAPPAASRYARPSASQIVVPSARTATGSAGSSERRKTRDVTGGGPSPGSTVLHAPGDCRAPVVLKRPVTRPTSTIPPSEQTSVRKGHPDDHHRTADDVTGRPGRAAHDPPV